MSSEVGNNVSFRIRRILVPIDGSPNSRRSADIAIDLASVFKSEIVFLNIVQAPRLSFGAAAVLGTPTMGLDKYYDYAESQGRDLINGMIQLAKSHQIFATGEVVKSSESTVQSIVDQAKDQKVDMIVIGSRGLSSFKKMIIGSVSSGVVTYADCPVLVVR